MALETPSWLNIDFTERILRLAEDDSSVRVIDISAKPATAKGDNYTSDMIRVMVEFTRKQGDKHVNEKKSLIFKFEPIMEGVRKDLIQKAEIFDTEMAMMTDTLKKMNDALGMRLGARVFHVRMERPLCLIMEDLAPQGYRMADRQAGLDLDHCLLAIRGLAKFHASSIAVCEKEPKHKDNYWKGIFSEDLPHELTTFFGDECMRLAEEVKNWPELDKSYAQKIKDFSPHLYRKGVEAIKRKGNEFSVINHGDCWVNNMLFRYDENGKPIGHIFVDFQLCVYTSPAIDLQYFLSTSPNIYVSENKTEMLLEEYLRCLRDTMEQLDCKTPPLSMPALKQALKERAVYGMIASMSVLPLIVVDKSEVKDIDEILSVDGSYSSPGLKSATYRKIMLKRIPQYAEMGLLDC